MNASIPSDNPLASWLCAVCGAIIFAEPNKKYDKFGNVHYEYTPTSRYWLYNTQEVYCSVLHSLHRHQERNC